MTSVGRRGPDFVGIGAQKSATTFVFEALKQHPNVRFPATKDRLPAPPIELDGRTVVTWPKEIQFLHGPNSSLTWEQYLDVFEGKPADMSYGEISPAYLVAPIERIAELRQYVPDVRLFIVLRDPVERDWSAIRMVAERRGELDDVEAVRAIAQWNQIRVHGDYVAGLRSWLSVFPPESMLVLPYEMLDAERPEFFRALCEHIGVPEHPELGMGLPPAFTGPPAELPDEIRRLLAERHASSAANLRELCGRDFSRYWRSAGTSPRAEVA